MSKKHIIILVSVAGLLFMGIIFAMFSLVGQTDGEISNTVSKQEEGIQEAKDNLTSVNVRPEWYEQIEIGTSKSEVEELAETELEDCFTEIESERVKIESCTITGDYEVYLTFENDELIIKEIF